MRASGREPALDENGLGVAWADLGAAFSAVANADRMVFTLRSLTAPELAARQLAEPAFPAGVWQRDPLKWAVALKEADTRPAKQAARAFPQAVFDNHPYGAEMTVASLMRIRVQDMALMHNRVLRPCYTKVSVVGAVDRVQADALVTQLLGRLPVGPGPGLAPVPEAQALQQAREKSLPFASAQAHVLLGQPGYARSDPDHLALVVGNHILGGGPASRLSEQVREQRGLTYSVGSHFAPGPSRSACRPVQTRLARPSS